MGVGGQEQELTAANLDAKKETVEEKEGLVESTTMEVVVSSKKSAKPSDAGVAGVTPPPDGGWGWVVVAASFFCNMILDGIGYSFGILLTSLMSHFNAGSGIISMVGSVLAGVIMLSGPIAAALVNKFGTRIVCISGAVTSACAIFVSTFAPNVPFLMFTYGVLGGFGLGLMYVPSVVAVGYWFEKRRSLVTGISTCGSGVGTIIFAPLVTELEKQFGWQGCNRILAGLCLGCVLYGATMKPVTAKKRTDEEDSIAVIKNENEKPIVKNSTCREEEALMSEENEVEIVESSKKQGGYMSLFKNLPFMMIMAGNLPAVMGLYMVYMFLPSMSEERGLTKEEVAMLISIIGAFNTAGRVISGAVTDHPKVDALMMTCFALFFGAMSPLLMDLCQTFGTYVAVAILFGLSLSAWPAVTSAMLVDLLGLEQLTSAFGVLTCIRGLAAFLGPPVGGFVIDYSGGNYSLAFWIATIFLGGSSLVHFAAYFVKRKAQRLANQTEG